MQSWKLGFRVSQEGSGGAHELFDGGACACRKVTFGKMLSERGKYGLKITDEKGEEVLARGWLGGVSEVGYFVGGLCGLDGW